MIEAPPAGEETVVAPTARTAARAWLAGVAGASIVMIAVGSAPALGATRYAAPAEAGAKNCSSPANACSLSVAMEGAHEGDEVIIEPGGYGSVFEPLIAPVRVIAKDVTAHGTDTSPGTPSALIFSDADFGVIVNGPGSTIRDIQVADVFKGGGASLLLTDASGEQVIARAGPEESSACALSRTAALIDSVCQRVSPGAAVRVTGIADPLNDVTLRNVTAVAPEGVGIAAESAPASERSVQIAAFNTIARGGLADIFVFRDGQPAAVTTSYSNYSSANTKVEGGGSLTDDGTSMTTGNQGLGQLFVDPEEGDFREALGAQTIGAGLIDPANGSFDFEGDARAFAPGTSCASTDIGADQFIPASGPAVASSGVSAIGQTGATLSGTANPLGGGGTVHFDFGAAALGGGPPASVSSTPTQCLSVADTPQPVTATLTGLAPGTTYYYRLAATDANATTTSAFAATFSTAALPAPVTTTAPSTTPSTSPSTTPPATSSAIASAPTPVLTDTRESATTWREGGALAYISASKTTHKQRRPPIGTTISFSLNVPAKATLTFTEPAGGRKVGKTCVAETKKNKREHRCTRTVVAATLTFSGHAGTNKVRFEGRLSKHRWLGTGGYTLSIGATASGLHAAARTLHFTIAH